MVNTVVVQGRLTRFPELKTTSSGKSVCSFSVAHNVDKDRTDFYDVICFGKTADFVSTYFYKGQEILVEGSLSQSRWTTKTGENRSKVEIIGARVSFSGKKDETLQAQMQERLETKEDEKEEDGIDVKVSDKDWFGGLPDELPF